MIINLHGLVIACRAESQELLCQLTRPFKYFLKDEGAPAHTVKVREIEPPYDAFPNAKASFSTPRNIVYQTEGVKIIDYFGKGVVVEENDNTLHTLYSRDRNFLQEAFFLLVSSLFGQFCDRRGLLRIHALALSYQNKAILVPVPPGGGKSTMAMAMLQEEGFKLISDDEPVLDRSGYIYPFPLRIGTLDRNKINAIPGRHVYKIDRMEFGVKYFIDCEYWQDKLEDRPLKESMLFISQRSLNGKPQITPTSKRRALTTLVRDAVIGVGLFQGLEFILQNSTWDVLLKMRTVSRRFILALRLLQHTTPYEITLSRDIGLNTVLLRDFIRENVDHS